MGEEGVLTLQMAAEEVLILQMVEEEVLTRQEGEEVQIIQEEARIIHLLVAMGIRRHHLHLVLQITQDLLKEDLGVK